MSSLTNILPKKFRSELHIHFNFVIVSFQPALNGRFFFFFFFPGQTIDFLMSRRIPHKKSTKFIFGRCRMVVQAHGLTSARCSRRGMESSCPPNSLSTTCAVINCDRIKLLLFVTSGPAFRLLLCIVIWSSFVLLCSWIMKYCNCYYISDIVFMITIHHE